MRRILDRRSLTPQNLARRSRIVLDRLRGLDFLSITAAEDVGLDPALAQDSAPSGNKYLVNVLKDLNISSDDSILDIGCGKGSAMRTMLKFPFARVDGVEISERIAGIAARNFRRLNADRSRIFVRNASLFEDYDPYNFVYFYNPFNHSIMSDVMKAVIKSVNRAERELIIVYSTPAAHDVVVGQGVFSQIGAYPYERGNWIAVYSNRFGPDSRVSTSALRQAT